MPTNAKRLSAAIKKMAIDDTSLPDHAVDPTGTILTPGKPDLCAGNGKQKDADGQMIECCCDECDWALACFKSYVLKCND